MATPGLKHLLKLNEYKNIILKATGELWPEYKYGDVDRNLVIWVESQIEVESGFNAEAVSPVGAKGLMQLMPQTALEVGLDLKQIFNPEANIRAGIKYLKIQYDKLAEIPDNNGRQDRLYWSFASYNGGRGYINKALALAKQHHETAWHSWETGKYYLFHRDCKLTNGKHPDYRQIWGYVKKIIKTYNSRVIGG